MRMVLTKFSVFVSSVWHGKRMNYFRSLVAPFLNKYTFGYFLMILLLMNSGTAYFNYNIGSKTEHIISLALLIISLLVFLLYHFDVLRMFKSIKEKRFKTPSIFLVFIVFSLGWLALSFLVNSQRIYNLNNYISILSVVIVAGLFISIYTFEEFMQLFSNSLLFLSLFAIFIYLFNYFIGFSWATSIHVLPGRNFYIESYFRLFYNFQYATISNYETPSRLMSIFWEPGVYGTMLLIAQFGEIFIKKRTNYFNVLIFIVASILTFSTATYILGVLIYIMLIFKNIKNRKNRLLIFILLLGFLSVLFIFNKPILNFLKTLLPLVFSKVDISNASFFTRIQSIFQFLKIFIRNPFFGLGGRTAYEMYMANSPDLIDAGTSTFGYMMAGFGLTGLVFSLLTLVSAFLNKRFNLVEKILLVAFIFALSSKENQTEIMIVMIFYFFFIAEIIPSSKKVYDFKGEGNNIFVILFKKDNSYKSLRDVVFSVVSRVLTMLIAILIIPVYSKFFSNDDIYGVWLIILSILNWVLMLDLGFGHGLKNKLIEYKKDDERKALISSTYIATTFISTLIFIVGSLVVMFLDINKAFGYSGTDVSATILKLSVIIIIFASSIELVLKNVNSIIQSDQKGWIVNAMGLVSNILIISVVLLLKAPLERKILYVSITYATSILIPYIAMNIYYFFVKYPNIKPSFKSYDNKLLSAVMKFGLVFFVIQIGNLLLFASNTIIIGRLFSSVSVVAYDKYTKFFFAFYSLFTAVGFPLWVATSKARAERNIKNMRRTFKILIGMSIAFSIISILFSLLLQPVFDIWLGDYTITVDPKVVIIILGFFITKFMTGGIIFFNNGLEKLKAQIYVTYIGIVIKLPLIFLIIKLIPSLDWSTILLVDTIIYLPYIPFGLMETLKELKKFEEVKSIL